MSFTQSPCTDTVGRFGFESVGCRRPHVRVHHRHHVRVLLSVQACTSYPCTVFVSPCVFHRCNQQHLIMASRSCSPHTSGVVRHTECPYRTMTSKCIYVTVRTVQCTSVMTPAGVAYSCIQHTGPSRDSTLIDTFRLHLHHPSDLPEALRPLRTKPHQSTPCSFITRALTLPVPGDTSCMLAPRGGKKSSDPCHALLL